MLVQKISCAGMEGLLCPPQGPIQGSWQTGLLCSGGGLPWLHCCCRPCQRHLRAARPQAFQLFQKASLPAGDENATQAAFPPDASMLIIMSNYSSCQCRRKACTGGPVRSAFRWGSMAVAAYAIYHCLIIQKMTSCRDLSHEQDYDWLHCFQWLEASLTVSFAVPPFSPSETCDKSPSHGCTWA